MNRPKIIFLQDESFRPSIFDPEHKLIKQINNIIGIEFPVKDRLIFKTQYWYDSTVNESIEKEIRLRCAKELIVKASEDILRNYPEEIVQFMPITITHPYEFEPRTKEMILEIFIYDLQVWEE